MFTQFVEKLKKNFSGELTQNYPSYSLFRFFAPFFMLSVYLFTFLLRIFLLLLSQITRKTAARLSICKPNYVFYSRTIDNYVNRIAKNFVFFTYCIQFRLNLLSIRNSLSWFFCFSTCVQYFNFTFFRHWIEYQINYGLLHYWSFLCAYNLKLILLIECAHEWFYCDVCRCG